jgi:hypothetical protein
VTEKVTLSLDKEAIRASLDEKGELKFNGALLAEELPRTYRLKITG